MPKKSNLQDWVKSARNMMRLEMHAGAKWYLVESRGRVKLEVRDEGKYQSRVLNYEWSNRGLHEAARRTIEIYKNFTHQLSPLFLNSRFDFLSHRPHKLLQNLKTVQICSHDCNMQMIFS